MELHKNAGSYKARVVMLSRCEGGGTQNRAQIYTERGHMTKIRFLQRARDIDVRETAI
jgi:hypothetical protein